MRKRRPLPLLPDPGPSVFDCRTLGVKLSRRACGARHASTKRAWTPHQPKIVSGTCRECPIGAAHAAGELPRKWPDGVALVEVVSPAPHAPALPVP